MKIAFHEFETGYSHSGALYFYSEVTRLLKNLKNKYVKAVPHNFFDVIRRGNSEMRNVVSSLNKEDVLVSNIGPYAHLYHFYRERFNGKFRIVRDIRTSSWAGFLLQEALSGPLTREGDLVLFPSEFCRQYFIHLFPKSLGVNNTAVSYPLADSFPKALPDVKPRSGLNVGYFGRLSNDKNFDQVLKCFVQLAKHSGERTYLHLAGHIDFSSTFKTVYQMRRFLARHGVSKDSLIYYGRLSYAEIWKFLRGLDVFVFPAIASVESLGRVLLEAQYAGVKTVAAHYAAAPEILPDTNLVPPLLKTNEKLQTISAISLGRVSVKDLVNAVEHATVGTPSVDGPNYQSDNYLQLVSGHTKPKPGEKLTTTTLDFIRAVEINGLASDLNFEEIMLASEKLIVDFTRYNDNRFTARLNNLMHAMFKRNEYPQRLGLHLNRLVQPNNRFTMGNAREHCRSAKFDPTIRIDGGLFGSGCV